MQRTYRLSTDHLPLDPDTQLGSFGPGADSKRSKAAYPPPRCVLDHKLNGCILSCKYTKLIVFAQNLWWMKDESIMTSSDLVVS